MLEETFSEYCEIVKKIAGILGFQPPECMGEVMRIFLQKYIEEGTEVEMTRGDIEGVMRVPRNQIIAALECLEKLGFLHKDPLTVYRIKYRFPNRSLDNSLYSPITRIVEELGHYRDITSQLIMDIGERTGYPHSVSATVDRKGFYEECTRLLDRNEEVFIFSHTPGIVLVTERKDPLNPLREFYFERMKQRLESGKLKIKYMFDLSTTKAVVREWIENGELENIRASIDMCESENEFLGNPRIESLEVRAVRGTHLPGMVIGRDVVVVGVKDPKSTDPKHAARGEVIRAPNLVRHFREAFLETWEKAEPVGSDIMRRILEGMKNEGVRVPEDIGEG
ncbi:hypothetical protein [Archaeoglobus sp.]